MSVKAKKFVTEKGYYEILEVSPTATTNEIQRSFERLCDEYVNLKDEDPQVRKTSAETLYTITKAYENLTDPFQRMNYDDRRFGGKQNNNNEVETIFKEGLKASRANNNDGAVRFFKETVHLFPHRPIYRVNLAIAYHESGNVKDAVKELRMALMLDPTNEFAQEVVAKLLFGVSDKKGIGFFVNKANRQLAGVIAVSVILLGTLGYGIPKIKSVYDKYKNSDSEKERLEKNQALKNKMPQDLRNAFNNPGDNEPTSTTNNSTVAKNNQGQRGQNESVALSPDIAKLDDAYKPEGKVADYSIQKATKKTYYKSQDMIVVDYENGSTITYKTQDVIGWKKDSEKNVPMIITKGNEIIPVQTDIPVTLPDGTTLNPGDPNFPASAFPEYEVKPSDNKNKSGGAGNTTNEVQNNEPPKAPAVNNQTSGNAPPPPPPVGGNIPGKKGEQ